MDVQRLTNSKAFIPTLLGLISGIYYYLLYSRIFTWLYTSADAGDWLTQIRWWMVPHAFGKPLYIVSIKLAALWPFGTDVDKVTVALSVIPAAITVAVTYLIAFHFTKDRLRSTAAALVLMGAVIFLSQATVLEQYTFMALWLALAYYFYIQDRKKLTLLFLGLLTASHILGLVVFVLWMVLERKQWREWVRVVWVYVVFGLAPYLLIAGMMAADTPRLIAGGLSIGSFDTYLSNPTSTGALAITEAPQRLFYVAGELVVSLGLAIVALFKMGKIDKYKKIALITVAFCLWFHITNWFPSTYKYVAVALPVLIGLVAIGLANMKRVHTYIVITSAIALIFANAFFFNANSLAEADPQATEYEAALKTLSPGSAVIAPQGGAWGFGLFYVMSQGYDLIPLMQHTIPPRQGYQDYLIWLEDNYGVTGETVMELAQAVLDNGGKVYFAKQPNNYWGGAFKMGDPILGDFLSEVYEVDVEALLD